MKETVVIAPGWCYSTFDGHAPLCGWCVWFCADPQIIRQQGSIMKCIDVMCKGFLVQDMLRDMLLNEDSENVYVYSEEEKKQMLYSLLFHMVTCSKTASPPLSSSSSSIHAPPAPLRHFVARVSFVHHSYAFACTLQTTRVLPSFIHAQAC